IRHGVIGNTSDFGSEVSGSSPDGGTPIALAVMTQDDRGDAACPSRRRPRGAPVVGIEETTAPAAVIVLAAGAGTRMKSRRPKVLHEIGGRSLLVHAVTAAEGTGPGELVVVLRHERDRGAEHLAEHASEVPGTGRAVQCGLEQVTAAEGTVLVTYGDVPLLDPATLRELVAAHEGAGAAATVLSARVPDPTGYGRILRSQDGTEVLGIVEH